MTIKIGINGFGRIGRTILRAAAQNKNCEIVHINDLTDTHTLAHLLKYDSVHGIFDCPVKSEEKNLWVGDKKIEVTAIKNPAEIPWGKSGVDVVFECTGRFRKKTECEAHIKGGAKKVVVSAPAEQEDITVVMGVNHHLLDKNKHTVISNGSCTTNCLAPIAKVLHEKWGIKKGLMTTIHSYTNDQSILDLPHKDLRRARAAAMSMIPTSTGAAKAIGLVLPELKGKLHGLSIRVPTPNVSCVDLTVELAKNTTKEEINSALRDAAQNSLRGILDYTDEQLVSVDFNGNPHSCIVDGDSTVVIEGNMAKVIAWYDNETGFSHRMLDVTKHWLA